MALQMRTLLEDLSLTVTVVVTEPCQDSLEMTQERRIHPSCICLCGITGNDAKGT